MKTCVFISGTNSVGKTTLAWEIINRHGGIDRITNDVTYCKDGKVCFAGRYGETKYGGVDRITNEQGHSCTSRLAEVVETGLKTCDVIICEGSYMDTFGMNLMNAMFKAEKYLLVNLYADVPTLYNRLCSRSNGKNGDGKRNFIKIAKKQKQAMMAAKKWQSIGVKVLQINTAETDFLVEVETVLEAIGLKD